jgi:hypothetical protein
MTPTLYIGIPPRKLAEIMSALYGLAMGIYSYVAHINGQSAFAWVPVENAGIALAWAFIGSSLVHGVGVKINGSWRWSPAIRFVGMAAHTAVIAVLFFSAMSRWTSAAPNYAFILFLFLVALAGTIRDLSRAAQGKEQAWTL